MSISITFSFSLERLENGLEYSNKPSQTTTHTHTQTIINKVNHLAIYN